MRWLFFGNPEAMYGRIAALIIYIATTLTLVVVLMLLFVAGSVFARDALRLHQSLDHGVVSPIQALLVLSICIFSPLTAIYISRYVVNRFLRRMNDTRSDTRHTTA
jgi:hypothetical protein